MADLQPVSTVHEYASCEILLTNYCNLACGYCIAKELPGPPISIDIGKRAVETFVFLAEGCKLIEFTFTGGEPLTRFGVLEAITEYAEEHATRSGMKSRFILKTNGSILNQNIVEYLQAHHIRVVVSIDGKAEVHDRHRKTPSGGASHAVVSANIEALLKSQVDCVAGITVHPDAASLVLENVKYLYAHGIENMDIGPAYGTVTWAATETKSFSQSLIDVAEYIRAKTQSGHSIAIEPLLRESDHVESKLAKCWGCHAGSTHIAFLPNGKIMGCSALAMLALRFPELVLGDVFEGLDQSSVDSFLQLAQAGDEERHVCAACQNADNCTGGCLAINLSTTGLSFTPPEVYCKTIKTIPRAWLRAWGD